MTDMFKNLLITFCLVLSLGVTAQTVSPPVPAQDQKLQLFLEGLQSFSATFEQTLFNEYDEPLENSGGTVYLQRPGKFHWVYTTPYSQYLISDGKDLWIYDEDLAQVTVSAISESIEKSPASILAGDSGLADEYIINDLGHLDGADWIELAPPDQESQYQSIRLGFNGDQLIGMVLFDNLGQTTRIVFKDGQRNPQVDPALFQFVPPEGVDVIDNRPQAPQG